MFQRLSNSWRLIKASAAVLRSNKKLIVFPIVSMIGVLIVSVTFAIPLFLSGIIDRAASGNSSDDVGITGLVVGFLFYLVTYTVIYFANSALVGAVMIHFRGGQPTLGDGFRTAAQHLGSIVGYALISSTVGMILRWIAEKGIVGQIVSSLIGFAWNVSTYLVVPVLVVEGVNPVEAIKRSVALLKKTWGEQIVGNMGMGAIFFLIFLAMIVLGFVPLVVLASGLHSPALLVVGILILIAAMIVLGLISSALGGIYTAAVYCYAVEGSTGGHFEEDLVRNAFRQK
jgi:ABC-type multidrug transport system fused ATPase/permease subunit